jgi:hypothetical protein
VQTDVVVWRRDVEMLNFGFGFGCLKGYNSGGNLTAVQRRGRQPQDGTSFVDVCPPIRKDPVNPVSTDHQLGVF